MKRILSFLPGIFLIIAVPIAGWHLLKNEKGTEATFLQNVTNKVNLTDGLVGHWTFDGPDLVQNVADVSGQGNHGNFVGFGATSTAVTEGKLGQGLSFDGVDDRVGVNYSASLNITGNITVTAWIKRHTVGDYGGIVAKTDGVGWNYNLYIDDVTNTFFFYSSNTTPNERNNNTAITDNEWHHIVATRNGTQVNFYLDGASDGSGSLSGSFGTDVWDVEIGRDGDWDNRAEFGGSLDDVRVYNRALSASEIKALYNMGSSLKMNVTNKTTVRDGLVGHWTFDGPDLAQNVADVSGQGNHGMMQNFGATSTAVTAGKIGQGFTFDGSDDRVSVNAASSLNDLDSLTYSTWINARGYGEGTQGYFATKSTNCCAIQEGWKFKFTVDDIEFEADFDGASDLRGEAVNEFPSNLFNRWVHVVVTWDGSANFSGVKIYRDGKALAVSGVNGDGSRVADTAHSLILGNSLTAQRTFNGSFDDVRIYNRALSAAEVKALYNMGSSLKMNVTNKTTVRDGLVGHWTFDGPDLVQNVADVSGQGNHGYMQNFGATSTAVTPGKLGQGLSFDGVNQYVERDSAVTTDAPLSLCAWFNMDDAVTQQVFVWVGDKDASNRYHRLGVENNEAHALTRESSSGQSSSATSTTAILVNEWYHACAVFNSDTDRRIFINGILEATNTDNRNAINLDRTSIGRQGDLGGDNYTNGSLDDVRIYNRALSADEVKALYNMGR